MDFKIENGILIEYKGNMSDVKIPKEVTSIGWKAFAECRSLTSVEIPEGVTSIGAYAFYACANLTYVELMRFQGAKA